MTLAQFDNGYWYATELKRFATTIGISAANLRKDQLEKAIRGFLASGKIESPASKGRSIPHGSDSEQGLRLDLPIASYKNDKATWDFVEREAQKMVPGLKRKSGARYRLNRWREEHVAKNAGVTYGDLVREYVRLSQTVERFAQIPSGRYINFLSDFFAAEKNATQEKALRAWAQLKKLDAPKNYRSWVAFRNSR